MCYPQAAPFIEKITFDERHWAKVLQNLIVFFKSYMQELLLGVREISTCLVCDKSCMGKSNLNAAEENSVTCK